MHRAGALERSVQRSRRSLGEDECKPPLLQHVSDDVLRELAAALANSLRPSLAVAFASTCHGIHDVLHGSSVLEDLREKYEKSLRLCEKAGWHCADVREAACLALASRGLTEEDTASMRILIESAPNLAQLYLFSNQIGVDGMRAFSSALDCGAMANIKCLGLGSNSIGDAGMIALCSALADGALANLVSLVLASNGIGNLGLEALSAALDGGALAHCEYLDLCHNVIGAGVGFSAALSRGALSRCEWLDLSLNQIDDAGFVALAEALVQGALPAQFCGVDLKYNAATESGKRALRAATKERPWLRVDLGYHFA